MGPYHSQETFGSCGCLSSSLWLSAPLHSHNLLTKVKKQLVILIVQYITLWPPSSPLPRNFPLSQFHRPTESPTTQACLLFLSIFVIIVFFFHFEFVHLWNLLCFSIYFVVVLWRRKKCLLISEKVHFLLKSLLFNVDSILGCTWSSALYFWLFSFINFESGEILGSSRCLKWWTGLIFFCCCLDIALWISYSYELPVREVSEVSLLILWLHNFKQVIIRIFWWFITLLCFYSMVS